MTFDALSAAVTSADRQSLSLKHCTRCGDLLDKAPPLCEACEWAQKREDEAQFAKDRIVDARRYPFVEE